MKNKITSTEQIRAIEQVITTPAPNGQIHNKEAFGRLKDAFDLTIPQTQSFYHKINRDFIDWLYTKRQEGLEK